MSLNQDRAVFAHLHKASVLREYGRTRDALVEERAAVLVSGGSSVFDLPIVDASEQARVDFESEFGFTPIAESDVIIDEIALLVSR